MIELNNKWLKIRATKQGGAILDGVLSDSRAFLRPYRQSQSCYAVLDTACFPLVPLGNRVAGSKFEFNNRTYYLDKNSDVSPFYHHGDAWLNDWEIESIAEDSLVMTLAHQASKKSPYTYIAQQVIRLEQQSLLIELEITNQGETLPFGLGLHPYFPRTEDMLLQAKAKSFWELDQNTLPMCQSALSSKIDFTKPNQLQLGLDNCFSGWDGKAQIIYPSKNLKLDIECSEILSQYLIYSPQGEEYFCFEPMSHVPNGLNMEDLGGMQVLQNGESVKGEMRITVSDV